MISHRLYKIFHYGSRVIAHLGIIPSTFDGEIHKATVCDRARKRFRLNTAMFAFWNSFIIAQLLRFYISKQVENFNLVMLFGVPCFIVMEPFILLTLHEVDCIEIFNDVIFYAKHVNSEYFPHYDPDKHKFSMFIDFCIIAIIAGLAAMYPFNLLVVVLYPKHPHFPGSALPNNCPLLIEIYVTHIYPIHMITLVYLILIVFCTLIFMYAIVVVPFVLVEFRLNRARGYRSCDELRKPPTLYFAWRTVQVLQLKINNCIGWLLVPTQIICLNVAVTCAFMLLQYNDRMKTSIKVMLYMWGIAFTTFWSFILLLGGYMHLYGQRIYKSWTRNSWPKLSVHEKKILKRFVKSCRQFQLSYGKTYVIKRLSVLAYMRQLMRAIFRALATLGRKSH